MLRNLVASALATVLLGGCYALLKPPEGYHWVSKPGEYGPGRAYSNDPTVYPRWVVTNGSVFGQPRIMYQELPPATPQEIAQDKLNHCMRVADQLLRDTPLGDRLMSPYMPQGSVQQLQTFGTVREQTHQDCERDPNAYPDWMMLPPGYREAERRREGK